MSPQTQQTLLRIVAIIGLCTVLLWACSQMKEGNAQGTGNISGKVCIDLNADGLCTNSEPNLSGVTVWVNGQANITSLDNYWQGGLTAGDHLVEIDMTSFPPMFYAPMSGPAVRVNLPADDAQGTQDFPLALANGNDFFSFDLTQYPHWDLTGEQFRPDPSGVQVSLGEGDEVVGNPIDNGHTQYRIQQFGGCPGVISEYVQLKYGWLDGSIRQGFLPNNPADFGQWFELRNPGDFDPDWNGALVFARNTQRQQDCSTPTPTPEDTPQEVPQFPNCESLLENGPGDWSSQSGGEYDYPGNPGPPYSGKDDVYQTTNLSAVQCLQADQSLEVCLIQTNWWSIGAMSQDEIAIHITNGWGGPEIGTNWDLPSDGNYLYMNRVVACEATPTPTPDPVADAKIDHTGPVTRTAGTTGTWDVSVTNNGEVNLTGSFITLDIGEDELLNWDGTTSGWVGLLSGDLSYGPFDLAIGDTLPLNLTLTAADIVSPTFVTTTAILEAEELKGQTREAQWVTQIVPPPSNQPANVSIEKIYTGPAEIQPGDLATYTIKLENLSSFPITITLGDLPPTGTLIKDIGEIGFEEQDDGLFIVTVTLETGQVLELLTAVLTEPETSTGSHTNVACRSLNPDVRPHPDNAGVDVSCSSDSFTVTTPATPTPTITPTETITPTVSPTPTATPTPGVALVKSSSSTTGTVGSEVRYSINITVTGLTGVVHLLEKPGLGLEYVRTERLIATTGTNVPAPFTTTVNASQAQTTTVLGSFRVDGGLRVEADIVAKITAAGIITNTACAELPANSQFNSCTSTTITGVPVWENPVFLALVAKGDLPIGGVDTPLPEYRCPVDNPTPITVYDSREAASDTQPHPHGWVEFDMTGLRKAYFRYSDNWPGQHSIFAYPVGAPRQAGLEVFYDDQVVIGEWQAENRRVAAHYWPSEQEGRSSIVGVTNSDNLPGKVCVNLDP